MKTRLVLLKIHRTLGPEPHRIHRVCSSELLGVDNRLLIDHVGETYVLKVTSKGKLILTK